MLKRDVQKFEDALEKLKAKMLLLGYTDYVDVCGEIATLIDKRCEGEKINRKDEESAENSEKDLMPIFMLP